MDANRFDAFVRALPISASRRLALGGLLGTGLAALMSPSWAIQSAAKKKRKKKRRKRKKKAATCADGTTRCGDACCAPDQCIGGACCLTGNVCGGNCCTSGDRCLAGACCPANRVCGAVCCAAEQRCGDPEEEICVFGSGTCAEQCQTAACFDRPLGPPLCGDFFSRGDCVPCASDQECVGTSNPYCLTSLTLASNNQTRRFSDCGDYAVGLCTSIGIKT